MYRLITVNDNCLGHIMQAKLLHSAVHALDQDSINEEPEWKF